MRLPGLLYKIGKVDTSKIEECVNALTSEQWMEWDLRQNRYKVHAATESYPFMFSEYGEKPKLYNQDTDIWKAIRPLVNNLESFYNTKAAAIVLVKLKPKTNIIPHTDGGWFIDTHRIHIPIITDPKIVFVLDSEKFHLQAGNVYEINNVVEHSVINPTDIGRVHLMVDLMPNLTSTIDYKNLLANEF